MNKQLACIACIMVALSQGDAHALDYSLFPNPATLMGVDAESNDHVATFDRIRHAIRCYQVAFGEHSEYQ